MPRVWEGMEVEVAGHGYGTVEGVETRLGVKEELVRVRLEEDSKVVQARAGEVAPRR